MSIQSFIKMIQDVMRQDAGVDGDAQRISQIVWLLFLKVFDAQEEEWELMEEDYIPIIPEDLQWRSWAANDEGITGDELLDFVNNVLFPRLKDLETNSTTDPRMIVVKSVFEDSYNYMKSGNLLREVINAMNRVDFTTQEDRHSFNDIYETILKDLQSAGNAGEYYTPRAVTQFIVDILNPQLGEKVADYACGTGGFLICALEHLKKQITTIEDEKTLQNSIFGVEKKPLPHALATTNLILHGIEVPNIIHGNALGKNIRDYTDNEKVDIIVANPPYGGTEEKGIQLNFPTEFRTSETADLFLFLFMSLLKENGRAGIVLPDSLLFGETSIQLRLKEKLLNDFNLHTIVRLPAGVFNPYTPIETNILFFENNGPTEEVWFFEHQLPLGYSQYTKTKPIQIQEFNLEKEWWNSRIETEYAWKVNLEDIKYNNYNLDSKNPNKLNKKFMYSSNKVMNSMNSHLLKINELLLNMKEVLNNE